MHNGRFLTGRLDGCLFQRCFTRLIDAASRNRDVKELREQVLPAAKGIVLEVGIGSGLNLPYYSKENVGHLYGIEPSTELLQMARRKTDSTPFPVTLLNQTAENMPLEDYSVDHSKTPGLVHHSISTAAQTESPHPSGSLCSRSSQAPADLKRFPLFTALTISRP